MTSPTPERAAGHPDPAALPASAVPRGAAGKPLPGPVLPTPPGRGTTSSPQLRRERAAAGIPGPSTGAGSPLLGSAPVRARAPGPAGASLKAHGSHPAGSTGRTYTIALPAGMELLNANDRDSHWARRRRITGALREAAAWLARQQRIPALPRAYILGVYEPPDRRRRDPANLYPSFKACVDGLVDAGVLADDDATHLDGPDMRLGEVCRQGRLVLCVTEIAATGGAA